MAIRDLTAAEDTKALLVRVLALIAMCCLSTRVVTKAQAQGRKASGEFKLETSAFTPEGDIPAKYTCQGEDVSPALQWTDPPKPPESSRNLAKSFALIVEDPDAPSGTFVHWMVLNLPEDTRELPEGVRNSRDIVQKNGHKGGIQLRNDFGKVGYNGPCPPPGKAHRYYFKLYELNSFPVFDSSYVPTKKDFEEAIKGHMLATAEVMGKYQRK